MAKTWTEKDVEFLRENYRILSIEEISLKLNRTPHSIEVKASKIGIRKTKKWTQKDIKFLKENYNLMSNPELGSALEVSVGSIERKANEYGLRKSKEAMKKIRQRWPDENIRYLRENYKRLPPKEICDHLGISLNNLYAMTRHYGLQASSGSNAFHKHSNKTWSNKEISFLLENYMKLSLRELSAALNRSINSITYKMVGLGISKYKKRKDWSIHEDNYLKDNYKSGLMIQMQKELNRTFKAIHTRANVLGLKRDTSTYIEREVEEILKTMNVPFQSQVRIDGFIADFLVCENKIIEVHGDYWHCNPVVYDKPKDSIQERKIKQDKMKRGCFKELGYSILYIWEYDLNNNYDQVVHKISRFCRSTKKLVE